MSLFYTVFSGVKLADILTGLLSLIFIYVLHFYYKYFTRPNPFPGPLPIPLVGSIAIFIEDIDAWFWKLNKKYGNNGVYELNIAGNRQIVINRAEMIDKFLIKDSSTHVMRTANNGLLDLFDLETKGVGLNHSYKHWKLNRHLFSQAIMPLSLTSKPNDILNPLFEEMAKYWIELKQPDNDGSIVDLAPWMRRFTADFISLLTTGKHISSMYYYCQKSKNEPATKEMIDSEEFISGINTFVSDNQIMFVPKILRNMPFIKPRVDRLLDNCNRFYGRLVDIIRKRRKEIEETISCGGGFETKRLDLLTSLIIANTQYDTHPPKNIDPSLSRPMTDDEIRGVMFDAFVAGTDTTVNTFCYTIYYLAHSPDVKKKLWEEIDSVFKDDPNKPITLEDLEKLKYTEAVLKETSRIRPAVSMISRYSNQPDEIAGRKWTNNQLFIMYVRGINNNPLYWKEPEKYNPDRFYKSKDDIHKNSFLMFGGGSRICLGRKIAIIELKTLLALVYRKFDIELVDMNAPLKVETSTITTIKELNIKVIPREKSQAKN